MEQALLRDIVRLTPLPTGVSAEQAFHSVFCVLRQRVSRRRADDLSALFSEQAGAVGSPCSMHGQEQKSPEAFDWQEFLRRVADHAGISHVRAEDVVRGVFAAMRSRLSPADRRNVLSELPSDIGEAWSDPPVEQVRERLESKALEGLEPAARGTQQEFFSADTTAAAELVRAVQHHPELPVRLRVEEVITAVACALWDELDDSAIAPVRDALPPEIQVVLAPCFDHRVATGGERRSEPFVARVAKHLAASHEEAQKATSVVLDVLGARLPASLPQDFSQTLLRLAKGREPADRHPSRAEKRASRSASHRVQSFHTLARKVQDSTGIDDAEQAVTALQVVLSGLLRRVTPPEAEQLVAQLPTELQERLAGLPPGPETSLTRETIEAELAQRLDITMERASRIVADVGVSLRTLISEGELSDVGGQLPADLRSILSDEVVHPTP